jgi:hypothetical protein
VKVVLHALLIVEPDVVRLWPSRATRASSVGVMGSPSGGFAQQTTRPSCGGRLGHAEPRTAWRCAVVHAPMMAKSCEHLGAVSG